MINKIAIFEDLQIGQFAKRTVRVTVEAIQKYAALTGDTNFIHTDLDRAAMAGFEGCVAHGGLICGYVGAVIGTELPGEGSAVIEGSFRCTRPIGPGATIYIRVEIIGLDADGFFGRSTATMKYVCSVAEGDKRKNAGRGEITVIVPKKKP